MYKLVDIWSLESINAVIDAGILNLVTGLLAGIWSEVLDPRMSYALAFRQDLALMFFCVNIGLLLEVVMGHAVLEFRSTAPLGANQVQNALFLLRHQI